MLGPEHVGPKVHTKVGLTPYTRPMVLNVLLCLVLHIPGMAGECSQVQAVQLNAHATSGGLCATKKPFVEKTLILNQYVYHMKGFKDLGQLPCCLG